jgi:hypothetical protein
MGMADQRQALAALPRQERPGTPCIGGWVSPRAGQDGCGKSCPTGIQSPDCPAHSGSLYALLYSGPLKLHIIETIMPFACASYSVERHVKFGLITEF